MTVVHSSARPPFAAREEASVLDLSTGLDFLCGACERVVLARVAPKFALAHSFPCPHCGALNEAP